MSKSSISGMLWLFSSKLFPPIINFAVFTYTARILAPEDFGLVALALSIIYIISSFLPSGWQSAIVKYQEFGKREFSTILAFLTLCGLAFALIACFVISLNLFSFQSQVFNLAFYLMAIKMPFDAAGHTLTFMLVREQKYKALGYRTILGAMVSAVTILSLLYFDFNIWALVLSQTIISIFNLVAVYIPTRKMLGWSFRWGLIKETWEFGLYNTLITTVESISTHFESFVIGSNIGKYDLGFFNIAKRLSNIINDILTGTSYDMSLPYLSNSQNDQQSLQRAIRQALFITGAITSPLFVYGFIYSETIFNFLFSEKWITSAGYFQFFCIAFLFISYSMINKTAIIVTNRSRLWFRVQMIIAAIYLPTLYFASTINIHAVLWSFLGVNALYFFTSTYLVTSEIKTSFYRYLKSLWPIYSALGITAFAAVSLPLMPFNNEFFNLCFSAILFLSCYVVLLLLFSRHFLSIDLSNKKITFRQ
ncbi:oligosaccharide flippase family protein [Photobacterium leiognathi]|uniref:oligosaccharide flippase family protein n=1 Tax=Photobacterium leiognathi TaxID=553611 RepID=UPI00298169C8|nr:oligosaccharide flippase family protein [Photobacterium leiognathi]